MIRRVSTTESWACLIAKSGMNGKDSMMPDTLPTPETLFTQPLESKKLLTLVLIPQNNKQSMITWWMQITTEEARNTLSWSCSTGLFLIQATHHFGLLSFLIIQTCTASRCSTCFSLTLRTRVMNSGECTNEASTQNTWRRSTPGKFSTVVTPTKVIVILQSRVSLMSLLPIVEVNSTNCRIKASFSSTAVMMTTTTMIIATTATMRKIILAKRFWI